ncbi:MAG: hypothetical protein LBG82_03295 [Clostridiales Family XIII bacterium]|nr:hypothetical protein [Clostridiales Family XIII bacterium]
MNTVLFDDKRMLRVGWQLVALWLIVFLILRAAEPFREAFLMPSDYASTAELRIEDMVVYAVIIVALVLIWRRMNRSVPSELGLVLKVRPLMFGIISGVVVAGVLWVAYGLMLDFRVDPESSIRWTLFILAFQAVSSVSAVVLVHGFFLSILRKRLGAVAAVCLVGAFSCFPLALFGYMNAVIPTVNSFLFATLCATVTLRTGNICWAAGFHWAWFSFSMSIFGIGELGSGAGPSLLAAQRTGYNIMTGGEFGAQYSILFTAALGFLWAALLLGGRLRIRKDITRGAVITAQKQ